MNNLILKTERLYLRKITGDDFSDLSAILGDVDVMYAWEHAFTDSEIKNWIEENIIRYGRDGYSYWAVIQKESNQLGIEKQVHEYY